jgi:hypothetical protein
METNLLWKENAVGFKIRDPAINSIELRSMDCQVRKIADK